MAKNTSIPLGNHFNGFITGQVKSSRFSSARRLLESLRKMLNDGEQSGIADYDFDTFMAELDSETSPR